MKNQHTRRGLTQEVVNDKKSVCPESFLLRPFHACRYKNKEETLFNNNRCVEDAEQQLLSIHLFDKKAFTLIELLVVVLILGILTAVVLPQYQKAVLKSRAAAQIVVLDAVYPALESCYLEKHDISKCAVAQLDVSANTDCPRLYSQSSCNLQTRTYPFDGEEIPVVQAFQGVPGSDDILFTKSKLGLQCVADASPERKEEVVEECKKMGFTQPCLNTFDLYPDRTLCK